MKYMIFYNTVVGGMVGGGVGGFRRSGIYIGRKGVRWDLQRKDGEFIKGGGGIDFCKPVKVF